MELLLRDSGAGQDSFSAQLHDVVVVHLRERTGVAPPPLSVFMKSYSTLVKRAGTSVQSVLDGADVRDKMLRLRALHIIVGLAYDRLIEMKSQPSGRLVYIELANAGNLVDWAFPGYAQSRLLAMVFAAKQV